VHYRDKPTMDNPKLQTQIDARRVALGRGRAGHEQYWDALSDLGLRSATPEPDTKKLDALLASLNGSAERFQTLLSRRCSISSFISIC
jgi:hypothetical protein